ncbi:DUF4126 family protein [Mycolicibacterium confluentis]|uniref:Membrane protein n=1 Tax=Mycolicibacterium confluentis TaxID=28047 RepID=A0A7I7XVD7_9MYCO|nr:DUF4126 family protein [Mycolicibacterium confluentis]MCV7317882.1 DUF4126 family protein [Mycolicibacterium confluentis]ORV22906.1 hypothetical protein AWB99_25490 [Mycolicibacterium confluentis]BBZ33260.1 membrane protein [Mycolicibacterium confluentis]
MTHFLVLLLALLIGVVAGLRAFSAPAAIAWAAALQWINLDGTWASWMGNWFVVILLTVLAVVELVTDQLPKTPSRKTPVQFGARLVTGGLAGAALGTAWGYTFGGLGAGMVGAVIGTLVGYELRRKLSDKVGVDLPVALTEDAIAVLGAFGIAALSAVL